AEFLLSESRLAFGDVQVSQIDMRSRRVRVQFESMLQCVGGTGEVLLAGVDDCQQVVSFDARWMFSDCLSQFFLGFSCLPLAHQSFRFYQERVAILRCLRRFLCQGLTAKEEEHPA